MNGRTLFFATEQTMGTELWSTDGTPEGTMLVKDVWPGWYPGVFNGETAVAVVNGFAYVVMDTSEGAFLCKTDGTSDNTTLIPLPCPLCPDFGVPTIAAVGSSVFFTGPSSSGGALWMSDGTLAGTAVVKSGLGGMSQLTDVGGTLFFAAYNGNELWKSDGTASGTVRVKAFSANITSFTALGSTLYFVGSDATNGTELWKSDGTDASTVIVKDLEPGGGGSNPTSLTPMNGTLYFVAGTTATGTEWFQSDGTDAGTVIVSDSCPGQCSGAGQALGVMNGRIYYVNPSLHLWATDGTGAGTVEVTSAVSLTSPAAVVIGSTLYFAPDRSRLWKSDGTTMGTTEISNSIYADQPARMGAIGNTLLIANNAFSGAGNELYKSDGTSVSLLKNINEDSTYLNVFWGALPNNRITLAAPNLSVTDGSLTGISSIHSMVPDGYGFQIGSIDYETVGGTQLWRTDGTTAGTILLKDFGPSPYISLTNFTNVDGVLYFSVLDRLIPTNHVWRSDGTVAGTTQFTTLGFQNIYTFASNGTLTFISQFGQGVWVSDGTDAGTYLVATPDAYELKMFNGLLYIGTWSGLYRMNASFTSASRVDGSSSTFALELEIVGSYLVYDAIRPPDLGYQLSRTNGVTFELVKRICNVSNCSSVGFGTNSAPNHVIAGGSVYFNARDETHGFELWKSDGTEAGTVLVADICPGYCSSYPSNLVTNGTRVFFTANDGVHGEEPWVTDGTPAGTHMLADLEPGTGCSYSLNALASGNLLFTEPLASSTEIVPYVICTQPTSAFQWTGPVTVGANVPAQLTVGPVDSTSQLVPCFSGDVHFTSSDPDATLPADTTWTKGDGFKSLQFTLRTTGPQTITATDNATGMIVGVANVTVQATTTALTTTTPNPQNPGLSVTFQATVTSADTTVSGGDVTFVDDGQTLGTVALTGDTATLTTQSLSSGAHHVTASYNGSANFGPSTSPAFTQWIRLLPAATIAASPASSSSINVSWSPITGAASYEIFRAIGTGMYSQIGTSASPSYPDTDVTSGTVYLYKVRGVDPDAVEGMDSATDIGTLTTFTDDSLTSGIQVKAVHFTELRTAIDVVRAAVGLPAATYTNSLVPGGVIMAVDIQEMRAALNETRAPLGLPNIDFTDPVLTGASIKVVHINQLRDGVR